MTIAHVLRAATSHRMRDGPEKADTGAVMSALAKPIKDTREVVGAGFDSDCVTKLSTLETT
jgi:hypothetical protein